MARKRLNKKVALIGSVVFVVLALAAILLFLSLGRDPEPFIKDGDAAMLAKDYEQAERDYAKASAYAKTDSLRIKVLFKLVDLYIETDQWRKVLGCWNNIILIDPSNVKARFARLKYTYIMADSGLRRVWREVESQATELIEVAEEEPSLLTEYTDQWDPFGTEDKDTGRERMGPYLYLLRGRAVFEIANMGALTDPDESLTRAINDLKKVQELEPNNVNASWHLARAVITRGDIFASRGDPEARNRAVEQAKEVLEQAVELAGADPRAHINLLAVKLMLARVSGAAPAEEQIQSLEPEYLSLVEKFPSSAAAFSALGMFYRFSFKNLDKAIEVAQRAVELDRENVVYALNAANLRYRKFSVYGQKQRLYEAIELAKNALTLPNAQDKPGPREWANRMNRISLYVFLAECYIRQIIEPSEVRTQEQKQGLMTEAEQTVHEIEQLIGIGEAPQVIMWRGMLELAKGNRNSGVRKLYAAYQQLKASKPSAPPLPRDPQYAKLSYTLAEVFKNSSELGGVREFLENALPSGILETRPEALLDYAEVLLKLNSWMYAISNINVFEERYWTNERSQTLRIKALLGANQFDEAEKELAKREPDDPNTIKLNLALVLAKIRQVQTAIAQKQLKETSPAILQELQTPKEETVEPEASVQLMSAELQGYWDDMAELVQKLLSIEPNSVEAASVVVLCVHYVREGKTEKAKAIVDGFLERFPDNTGVLFYKRMLSEPDPRTISQQRRKEIEKQVLSAIADPARRAVNLGRFYHANNELENAAVEFRKVFEIKTPQEQGTVSVLQKDAESKPRSLQELALDRREEKVDLERLAATYLFEIVLATKDWKQAEQIAETVRHRNLDDCDGEFFAARLAVAKAEYADALARLGECLKQNPVFSRAYILRSNVHAALGDEAASVENAKKAASLNPLDGTIARGLAFALYRRNRQLGNNATSDQIIETRDALINAIRLNLGQWRQQLESLYAEYISDEKPAEALAIRQQLQKASPSVENALLLGNMAKKMALRETDAERKEALFAIAASSFKQAREMDPQNRGALEAQAELFRVRGQPEKAVDLLADSEDKELLWIHYYRDGKYERAKQVLQQLYKSEPQDSNVVRGLLFVAERTADKEGVKKYCEELVSLSEEKLSVAGVEDAGKSTIESQLVQDLLLQIQTFLKVGLVKEAEHKLQSFKEKYPDERRALLLEAWLAMKQGRLTDALELTNRHLETNQGSATAWRLRGEINLLKGSREQAIDDLKTSKSYSPGPDTRLVLAKAYLGAGREEDAITELRNVIDHPQAPMRARELLEQVYLQSGRKEPLKRFYDETMEKFPDDVLWYKRAGAFAIAGSEFDRAERLYAEAWGKSSKAGQEADPAALDGYLQTLVLGAGTPNAATDVWHPEKLEKVFEVGGKCVDTDFAAIAYLRMAEAKMKLGDNATAIEYCRKAVAKAFTRTSETFAFEILQRMYSLLGAQEVSKYCRQMLETDPDSLTANLAMFYLTKVNGEYNKAVRYIDKCLEIAAPTHPRRVNYTVRKARILQLAYNKTSDNNYLKRAIAEYESLLTKMPNNTIILNNLAYMLAKNGERLAQALKYAKRAYEARPNDPAFLDTYGYVLYKNGKNLEAAESLQAALQQYELSGTSVPAEVYENLGMIKEELGEKAEALAAYEQALEIGADELSQPAIEQIRAAIERLSQQGGTENQEP